MSAGLPKQIDALKMAESGRLIEGQVACQADGRLAGLIIGCEDDIHFSLDFGRQDNGQLGLTGRIQCTVSLNCQRCLEPVSIQLDCPVALGIVSSESQMEQLPQTLEPLVCGDGPVELMKLIEDELILALPIVPVHGHCEPPSGLPGSVSEDSDMEKRNPFSVLKDLK